MTATGPAGTQARLAERRSELIWQEVSGRRGTIVDWVLVALVWISLALSIWLVLWSPEHHWSGSDGHEAWLRLRYADAAVSALILISICWRWLRFRIGRIYLRRHWWEVIALVPLLVGGPMIVWVVILLARVVRVVDRTDNVLGDRITAGLTTHFSGPIVEAIKRPLTVAMLDEVIAVIEAGTYAKNVKAAIDENHQEIESMVLDLVRQDPTTGRLRHLPFHDDIVRLVADTVLRIVDGALDDPRTDELVRDVISNSATQLRQAVRSRTP